MGLQGREVAGLTVDDCLEPPRGTHPETKGRRIPAPERHPLCRPTVKYAVSLVHTHACGPGPGHHVGKGSSSPAYGRRFGLGCGGATDGEPPNNTGDDPQEVRPTPGSAKL